MKKLMKVLFVVMFLVGFSSCMSNDFEEIEEEGIEVPVSTDIDDDEVPVPGGHPNNGGK